MPYLVIRESGAESTLPITDPEITVGRSRQNHVRLLTEQSSRHHCKLVKTEKGYRVVDGNSSNGTYVNDQKIDKRFLKDGDIIYFGGRNAVAVAFHA